MLDALALDPSTVHTPALPGFVEPAAADFPATMHAYADWLAGEVDRLYAASGPVDLVGHDWGALLALRVAHLRRARIRSWTLVNGAFDPQYRGHFIARVWATPVLGDLSRLVFCPLTVRMVIRLCHVPAPVAAREAARVTPSMKRCIVKLYRSAGGLREFGPWYDGLDAMPERGLVVWSGRDPFMPRALAERVSARTGAALHVEEEASHWLPLTHPAALAQLLADHWRAD